jgi:hypothetical protein
VDDVYFYFAHDVVAVRATRIPARFLIQEGVVRMQSWQGHGHLVQEGNLDISSPTLRHWAAALRDAVIWIIVARVVSRQVHAIPPIKQSAKKHQGLPMTTDRDYGIRDNFITHCPYG